MKTIFTLLFTTMWMALFAQNSDPASQVQTKNTNYKKQNSEQFIQNVCDTTFFDGTETGNTNLWTIVGCAKTAITTNPYAGTYCMQLDSIAGGHDNGIMRTFANIAPASMSYSVRSSTTNMATCYFVPRDQNSDFLVYSYFDANGLIRFNNSYTTPYVADTWYNIEFRNIDWTAKTTDLYINNVYHTVVPFYNSSSTGMSVVNLYSFQAANSYYDNILFGSGQPPVPNLTVNSPVCHGDTGSISNTITGGTPPFTYAWSNSATTKDISGVITGIYTVTVTDSLGCANIATDSITSINPEIITLIDSIVTPSCYNDSTGSIFTSTNGGTPTYSYQWNNGDTIDDITNLGAGNYTISVTDSAGCVQEEIVTITEPDSIAGNGVVTNETISGNDGAIDLSTSGGTPNYTYNWSSGATTEDVTGLVAGTYTVTITDSLGCNKVITYTVNNTVGIIEKKNSNDFSIYPNPASQAITITYNGKATTIEIYNAIGKQITTISTQSNRANINVAELAKGVYFIRIGSQTKKLLVQ